MALVVRAARACPPPSCNFTSAASFPSVLFVLGGPGAGKGTQSSLLSSAFPADVRGEKEVLTPPLSLALPLSTSSPYGCIHLSVGSILRERLEFVKQQQRSAGAGTIGSDSDEIINACLQRGQIVPGYVTIALLKQKILDLQQAQLARNPTLQPIFIIDGFPRSFDNVNFYEQQCTPIRNVLVLNCEELTMRTRLKLRQRVDDTDEVITTRFRGYRKETMPVLERMHARNDVKVWEVDGEGDIPTVFHRITTTFANYLAARQLQQ